MKQYSQNGEYFYIIGNSFRLNDFVHQLKCTGLDNIHQFECKRDAWQSIKQKRDSRLIIILTPKTNQSSSSEEGYLRKKLKGICFERVVLTEENLKFFHATRPIVDNAVLRLKRAEKDRHAKINARKEWFSKILAKFFTFIAGGVIMAGLSACGVYAAQNPEVVVDIFENLKGMFSEWTEDTGADYIHQASKE